MFVQILIYLLKEQHKHPKEKDLILEVKTPSLLSLLSSFEQVESIEPQYEAIHHSSFNKLLDGLLV